MATGMSLSDLILDEIDNVIKIIAEGEKELTVIHLKLVEENDVTHSESEKLTTILRKNVDVLKKIRELRELIDELWGLI